MDIYNRLHDDHVETQFLLKEIEKTTSRSIEKRRELFQQLKSMLISHRKLEEAVFYPGLRGIKEAKIMLVEALNEHHLSSIVLEHLDKIPIEKRTWMGKFTLLKEILEHHLREEESQLFMRSKKLFDSEQVLNRVIEMESQSRIQPISAVA